MALVKDVSLSALGEEDDAGFVARVDFPYASKAAFRPAARPLELLFSGRLRGVCAAVSLRRGYVVCARCLIEESIIMF